MALLSPRLAMYSVLLMTSTVVAVVPSFHDGLLITKQHCQQAIHVLDEKQGKIWTTTRKLLQYHIYNANARVIICISVRPSKQNEHNHFAAFLRKSSSVFLYVSIKVRLISVSTFDISPVKTITYAIYQLSRHTRTKNKNGTKPIKKNTLLFLAKYFILDNYLNFWIIN